MVIRGLKPIIARSCQGIIPDIKRVCGGERQRKRMLQHLAVCSWSVQHRRLIECWCEVQVGAFGQENNVVMMSISVGNQRTKCVKPSKMPRILLTYASRFYETGARPCPRVCRNAMRLNDTECQAFRQ